MRLQSKAAGEASTGRRETQRARQDQSMNSHSLLQLTPKNKYFSCVLLTLPRGHRPGESTHPSCDPLSFPATSSWLPFVNLFSPLLFLVPSFPLSLPSISFFLSVPLSFPFLSFSCSLCSASGGEGRTVVSGGGLIGVVMLVTF